MNKKKKPFNTPEPENKQTVASEVAETEEPVETETATGTEETVKATQASPQSEEKKADPGKDTNHKQVSVSAEELEAAKRAFERIKKEKEETVALLQRNQADFENYRRRNASLRLDSLDEGKRNCVKDLLPVLDNFDRALEQCGEELTPWQEGIKLVYKQLMDTLKKQGLSEIETDGKFDPTIHEAVMQEAVEGKESGTILAVFQKGYRVGDKVIRPSMVKVAQ